jgi:hypothetical protein
MKMNIMFLLKIKDLRMSKWRKKPVVVEAYQFLGFDYYDGVVIPLDSPKVIGDLTFIGKIKTLEDTDESCHYVCANDYIITGISGEMYACKSDIFLKTYELVDGEI